MFKFKLSSFYVYVCDHHTCESHIARLHLAKNNINQIIIIIIFRTPLDFLLNRPFNLSKEPWTSPRASFSLSYDSYHQKPRCQLVTVAVGSRHGVSRAEINTYGDEMPGLRLSAAVYT